MKGLLPAGAALTPDRGATCTSPVSVGVPEDLDDARRQRTGRKSDYVDDARGRVGTLLAQHRQDVVELPSSTGCADLHEVGSKKLAETLLVGSAGRRLELAFELGDVIECPTLLEVSHGDARPRLPALGPILLKPRLESHGEPPQEQQSNRNEGPSTAPARIDHGPAKDEHARAEQERRHSPPRAGP